MDRYKDTYKGTVLREKHGVGRLYVEEKKKRHFGEKYHKLTLRDTAANRSFEFKIKVKNLKGNRESKKFRRALVNDPDASFKTGYLIRFGWDDVAEVVPLINFDGEYLPCWELYGSYHSTRKEVDRAYEKKLSSLTKKMRATAYWAKYENDKADLEKVHDALMNKNHGLEGRFVYDAFLDVAFMPLQSKSRIREFLDSIGEPYELKNIMESR